MADHSLSFQIVSPEKLVLSGTAHMIVVPGESGDFGILPHHAPLVSTLRPGLLSIYENDVLIHQIYVSDGFVRVTGENCTVLTEESLFVSDLNGDAILEEIQKIQDELIVARTVSEEQSLKKDLSYLQVKIAIFRHLNGRGS